MYQKCASNPAPLFSRPTARWQRRAYALAKYTGQRCGDSAAMTRAHRKGGAIRVVRQTTGAELWIPEHSDLAAELARGTGGLHMSLFTKVDGSGFDGDSLSMWFCRGDRSGWPSRCLNDARATKDCGADARRGGLLNARNCSITGHAALAEIKRYTKAVNQKKLATAAIYKMEKKEGDKNIEWQTLPSLRVANGSQEVDAAMNRPCRKLTFR